MILVLKILLHCHQQLSIRPPPPHRDWPAATDHYPAIPRLLKCKIVRRQLWGTGTRVPLDSQQFHF